DVEPDAGNADLLLISDDGADRLRVAEVAIRAQDAGDGVTDRHAIAHLRQRAVLMLAEHLDRAVLEPLFLRPKRRQFGGERGGLLGDMFFARRVAKAAPGG